jgi:hypothetical protein
MLELCVYHKDVAHDVLGARRMSSFAWPQKGLCGILETLVTLINN